MSVFCQVIRFAKDSSNVDGATQDVNLNFTPKAIIVYSDANTADNTASAHYQWCIGFSDGTTHACVTGTSDDGDASSDTACTHRNNLVYARLAETSNASLEETATCAFSTNKVTFTWTVNSNAATYIHMIAYGGTEITSAKVNTVEVGRATAGTQDYTGLGFNPSDGSAVLFTLVSDFTSSYINTNIDAATMSFGCALSSAKRWSVAQTLEHASDPSDTWRHYSNTHNIVHMSGATGTVVGTSDFDSWITDGFRLDWDSGMPLSTWVFSYLVINGGTWDVGTLNSPASATNNVDTTVSVSSRTIKGLLMATSVLPSASYDTSSTVGVMSMGATDGMTSSTISNIDEDNVGSMDSYRINSTGSIIIKPLTTDGAVAETATFDSFSTNNFRLDWTAVNAAQPGYGWVVVAETNAPTFSGVRFKKGTFTRAAAAGNVDVTDVGFQAKAILIMGENQTTELISDHVYYSFGFADNSLTNCCTSIASADNLATALAYHNTTNTLIQNLITTGGSTNSFANASITIITDFGFRVNFSYQEGTTAIIFHYIAIGGDDITNTKVGTQSVGTATTGSKGYTGVGFQPDFLLTASAGFPPTASSYTYDTTMEFGGGFQLGCAKSTSARWAIATAIENTGGASDTWRYQRGDKCFSYLDHSTGSLLMEADFVSFDSDGFTFNYTTNTGGNNANAPFIYLAIKGGVWDVGYFQSPATNTTVVTNTSNTGTLKGIMTADAVSNLITSSTISSDSLFEMGMSDGTNTGMNGFGDLDNQATTVNSRLQNNDNICKQFYPIAVSESSTILGTATVTFSTSSFTTSWSSTDGTQRYIPYWAVSQSTGAPPAVVEVPPSVSHANIHQMFDNRRQNVIGTIFG